MTQKELEDIFQTTALFDKDSKEYQIQSALNSNIPKKEESDPLTTSLGEATHLDEDTKKKYLDIANIYTSAMAENILKDQFELNRAYPTFTVDEWNDFLSDRIVSTYIAKHKRTLLKAAAELNLALPGTKNKRDSLQVIKNIEDKEQGEANKNIVIIRIPDIYDE